MIEDIRFRERKLDDAITRWIGSGIQFPGTWDKITGRTRTNKSLSRINQSIHFILSTRKGERFFLPEFGCDLHDHVFDLNNRFFADIANMTIREALGIWEKRIVVVQVQVFTIERMNEYPRIYPHESGNYVPIEISYRTSRTNVDGNYVWPFRTSVYNLR